LRGLEFRVGAINMIIMMKNSLLTTIVASVLFVVSCNQPEEQHFEPDLPNVLFIAIDDLKPMLGCYGDSAIITPNIDALAVNGAVFLNNHCQQAVCGPSRASLLTGMYPDQIGITDFSSIRDKNPDIVMLPQYFKNKGYTTVNISKIFDYRTVGKGMDSISWSWPYFPAGEEILHYYSSETGPVTGYFYQSELVKQTYIEKKAEAEELGIHPIQHLHKFIKPATECLDLPDHAYKDGVFANRAIEDLKKLSKEGNPFFLAVGFERPHLPWTAPKKYWDMYDREAIDLVEFRGYAQNDLDYYYSKANELRSYTDEEGNDAYGKLANDIPLTEEEERLLVHGYMAAVSYIDVQVGKILAQLEALELEGNTIVVLWGDHGWHLGDHGLWGKATNFEQATRSPLIISVPGLQNFYVNQATEFVDLYPTLCELAGLYIPESLPGHSLVDILYGVEDPDNLYAFSQFTRGDKMGYAVRDDRYRYVEWMEVGRHVNPIADYSEPGSMQLFDYLYDPHETVNIAGEDSVKKAEAKLATALHEWLKLTAL
jgi:iduronate 2-sulfatase